MKRLKQRGTGHDGLQLCRRPTGRASCSTASTTDLVCRNPRIIAEVKGGAHRGRIPHGHRAVSWPTPTGVNAGDANRAPVPPPVELWDAVMAANDWLLILSGDEVLPTDAPWPLRASLADWSRMAKAWLTDESRQSLQWLRRLGHGRGAVLRCHHRVARRVRQAPQHCVGPALPGVPNYGDVTAVDWSAVEPRGHPHRRVPLPRRFLRRPTQRRPPAPTRLQEHFAYAIQTLRPRLVVIENVSGLLSADAHCDVEPCPWCVGDEPDGPYAGTWSRTQRPWPKSLMRNGAVFARPTPGAPHRRERVFVVAADAARERHDGAGNAGAATVGRTCRRWRRR